MDLGVEGFGSSGFGVRVLGFRGSGVRVLTLICSMQAGAQSAQARDGSDRL